MDRTLTHRDYMIKLAGNLDTAADRGDMEAIDRIGAEILRMLALCGPFGIIVTSECDGQVHPEGVVMSGDLVTALSDEYPEQLAAAHVARIGAGEHVRLGGGASPVFTYVRDQG